MTLTQDHDWGRFEPSDSPAVRWLNDGRLVVLLEEFVYVDPDGVRWVCPKGMTSDGASVPRFGWFRTPPFTGRHRLAALPHDQYCSLGQAGLSPAASPEVHWMYYRALRCAGVSFWEAMRMWIPVRLFGPRFRASEKTDA